MADTIHVGMADLVAIKKNGVLVTLGLGSCIGLVLFDQEKRIAGMAHIMLPDSRESASVVKPGKFADTAVPKLLDEMKALGAGKTGIKAKLAGGAQMFNIPGKASSFLAVGARNAEATKEWLKKFGIPVVAEDTGGSKGRSVEFNIVTLMLTVKTLGMGTKEI